MRHFRSYGKASKITEKHPLLRVKFFLKIAFFRSKKQTLPEYQAFRGCRGTKSPCFPSEDPPTALLSCSALAHFFSGICTQSICVTFALSVHQLTESLKSLSMSFALYSLALLLKPFAVLHMGANLEKSLFAPRAYAVPLCPKGEIVFVCTLRPLWSCYAPRAFAVFVCFATSKSLYTSRATLYSLYMVCAPMQSPFASQPQKSPHITRNLIESLYGLRTLAVPMQSKVRESLPIFCHLCSLLIPCEPMQSPYISPT